MIYVGISVLIFISLLAIALFGRDKRGFNRKGIHKNGTRFDDLGYDKRGYDKNGYNRSGFDKNGYDVSGFNREGYKIDGRNAKGKYNRLYDKQCYINQTHNKEGFLNPQSYPINITPHARERIYERHPNGPSIDADKLVREVYSYGKSSHQIMKSSAAVLREIENHYENRIALIYNGYIYIFSEENVLITMYKNEKVII